MKDLKVLDLAENNLLYLPYGLKEVELQAIWLSENQSKSLIQARVKFDASVLSVNRLFCEIDHFVETIISLNQVFRRIENFGESSTSVNRALR